ncbi:MAG: hypothetical protein CMI16_06115 [Opitutaceae bacterium]|nr:hypothetical protein [Opitutaceae bacterium]
MEFTPAEDAPQTSSYVQGFYLHTSWEFAYPFAVRSWDREDYRRYFQLLKTLNFNLVMFWPLTEAMPAPLSTPDRTELEAMRKLVDDAHGCGMDFWLTFCPNLTSRPEIAADPFKRRHLYPFRIDVRLDDPEAKAAYLAHRSEILKVLNNADAYVTIDGDPGGYPEAKPRQFVEVLENDRAVIDRWGVNPQQQKLIPWIWNGWGSDWEKHGFWNEPLEPFIEPFLEELRTLPEPWELLPGRHIREGRGNGRTVLEMTERVGLTEKSTLFCYEAIEYEPTPPAVVIQFDDIRRILKQEASLLEKSRGVMGNAQQPIMALPNLFFFARATSDPGYLDRSDIDVLRDLAVFLGGDAELLVPAWQCLDLNLDSLPMDLAERLRGSLLSSVEAQLLPSGSEHYLELLARFAETRLEVLQACSDHVETSADAADRLCRMVSALYGWWLVHRYVFSGENGTDFHWDFTHPKLMSPIEAWLKQSRVEPQALIEATVNKLVATGDWDESRATVLLGELVDSDSESGA